MQLTTKIENIIKSPLVEPLNIIIRGLIDQIDGQILTITKKGKKLSVQVDKKTQILMIKIYEQSHEKIHFSSHKTPEKIDFKVLKIKDKVVISTEVKLDGSLKAKGITLVISKKY